jgi:hypothetical protein
MLLQCCTGLGMCCSGCLGGGGAQQGMWVELSGWRSLSVQYCALGPGVLEGVTRTLKLKVICGRLKEKSCLVSIPNGKVSAALKKESNWLRQISRQSFGSLQHSTVRARISGGADQRFSASSLQCWANVECQTSVHRYSTVIFPGMAGRCTEGSQGSELRETKGSGVRSPHRSSELR